MPNTLRVQHPLILRHPALWPWLGSVCAAMDRPKAAAFIADLCGRSDALVLLGVEDRPCALLCAELPSPLNLFPWITLGYNDGSPALGREMMRQAAQWFRAHGHTTFQAINGSGRSDAAYARGLRCVGEVTERHSLLTVALREEEQDGAEVSGRARLGV